MPRFVKKPVEIEAYKLPPNASEETQMIPGWFVQAIRNNKITPQDDGSVSILTLEGIHRGDVGDWIIKGIKGEFYPCKPDIFEMTYDQLPEELP